jgi:hypothetical protein
MTPLLLFPAALGALITLAIPLAIHLARRSDLRRVDFAALRWLSARPRPRSRLRFDEWVLLAMRLLLLTLIALWLARPAIDAATDTMPWVGVVPGATAAALPTGAHGVWLAPGFPPLDRPAPDGPVAVPSLLRQLDAELPRGVRLTVVVPPELNGDAERPRLSRTIDWRTVAGVTPSRPSPPLPPAGLIVRYAAGREPAVRYFSAAATAWRAPDHAADIDVGPTSQPLPGGPRPVVWLAPGPVPPAAVDWVRHGGTILVDAAAGTEIATDTVAWADAVGKPLMMSGPLGRGRVLRWQRRVNPEAMPELLDPDFAARLAALLTRPRSEPARVAARDFVPTAGGPTYPPPARDLQPWLALLIAAVFLVERILASGRRARVTA